MSACIPRRVLAGYFDAMQSDLTSQYSPETSAPWSRATFAHAVPWETLCACLADVEAFLDACDAAGCDLDGVDDERIGADLYLTRSRDGAGFWDGRYDWDGAPRGNGRKLTNIAHAMGEPGAYVAHDEGGDVTDPCVWVSHERSPIVSLSEHGCTRVVPR